MSPDDEPQDWEPATRIAADSYSEQIAQSAVDDDEDARFDDAAPTMMAPDGYEAHVTGAFAVPALAEGTEPPRKQTSTPPAIHIEPPLEQTSTQPANRVEPPRKAQTGNHAAIAAATMGMPRPTPRPMPIAKPITASIAAVRPSTTPPPSAQPLAALLPVEPIAPPLGPSAAPPSVEPISAPPPVEPIAAPPPDPIAAPPRAVEPVKVPRPLTRPRHVVLPPMAAPLPEPDIPSAAPPTPPRSIDAQTVAPRRNRFWLVALLVVTLSAGVGFAVVMLLRAW